MREAWWWERLRQVDGGIERHDQMALGDPGVQRGGALQTAVRRAVILAFQPGVEALVEVGDAGQLVGLQRRQELLADGAEETFHLLCELTLPLPWGRCGQHVVTEEESAYGTPPGTPAEVRA